MPQRLASFLRHDFGQDHPVAFGPKHGKRWIQAKRSDKGVAAQATCALRAFCALMATAAPSSMGSWVISSSVAGINDVKQFHGSPMWFNVFVKPDAKLAQAAVAC
jgi:hypothetical protein